MSTSFDPVAFKQQQQQNWDQVADGWLHYWAIFEACANTINQKMVAMAHIQPGHRVLDVATGLGEPALTVAQAVGTQGQVIGIDQSSQMLNLARKRGEKWPQVRFLEMDAEQIDFEPASFDAITCRWGLMFLPHCQQTLEKLRKLLRPQGHFVATVWGQPSEVPIFSQVRQLIQKVLQPPSPPAGTPDIFDLGAPGKLEALLHQAGFEQIQQQPLTVTYRFASSSEYLNWLQATSPTTLGLVRRAKPEQQASFWQQLETQVSQQAQANGEIQFVNTTVCGVGQRLD